MPDDDLTGIIDDAPIADAEPQEETVETPEDPVAEAEPEPTPEPEAEKPVMVPLAAMTEERVKRQMLEQQLAELQKPKEPEPVPLPDVLEDQSGFAQTIQQQTQTAILDAVLTINETSEREKHGSDAVDAAFQAAQQAGVAGQFAGQRDAWTKLMSWHRTQEAAREIGDPTTYKERIKQEVLKEVQAELAAKQITAAPSLAGETNMGGRSAAPPPTLTPLDDLLG